MGPPLASGCPLCFSPPSPPLGPSAPPPGWSASSRASGSKPRPQTRSSRAAETALEVSRPGVGGPHILPPTSGRPAHPWTHTRLPGGAPGHSEVGTVGTWLAPSAPLCPGRGLGPGVGVGASASPRGAVHRLREKPSPQGTGPCPTNYPSRASVSPALLEGAKSLSGESCSVAPSPQTPLYPTPPAAPPRGLPGQVRAEAQCPLTAKSTRRTKGPPPRPRASAGRGRHGAGLHVSSPATRGGCWAQAWPVWARWQPQSRGKGFWEKLLLPSAAQVSSPLVIQQTFRWGLPTGIHPLPACHWVLGVPMLHTLATGQER